MFLAFILAIAGGYLLGSIPFGLVITRLAGLGDVRAIGSGNIGATNVLRTGRRDLALATLVLDAGKAGVALLIARAIWGDRYSDFGVDFAAGAAAFVGHCFPVWLNFKGGKGVATFFGVLFAGVWPLGLVAGVTWLAVAAIFRFSSLAALCAAAITPILALAGGFDPTVVVFTAALTVLIFLRHRPNIRRLLNGTEPRIGADKTAAEPRAPSAPGPAATPTETQAPPTP